MVILPITFIPFHENKDISGNTALTDSNGNVSLYMIPASIGINVTAPDGSGYVNRNINVDTRNYTDPQTVTVNLQ